ncbi:hypothetical protein BC833DRAFT_565358 [Globomyces pollinis-pini]|nr:hypothetical protein BC833DRAFT_565358 [Globomyces pollinis-pini]
MNNYVSMDSKIPSVQNLIGGQTEIGNVKCYVSYPKTDTDTTVIIVTSKRHQFPRNLSDLYASQSGYLCVLPDLETEFLISQTPVNSQPNIDNEIWSHSWKAAGGLIHQILHQKPTYSSRPLKTVINSLKIAHGVQHILLVGCTDTETLCIKIAQEEEMVDAVFLHDPTNVTIESYFQNIEKPIYIHLNADNEQYAEMYNIMINKPINPFGDLIQWSVQNETSNQTFFEKSIQFFTDQLMIKV